jgi:uncharacterized protein (DUF305 family)
MDFLRLRTPKEKTMKTAATFFAIIALVTSAAGATAQNGPGSTKEFKAADMSMMKNMNNAPYSGNPDVDFRTHMIPHHVGAIAMAKVALKYAKDAETKKMAQQIIDEQEKQVADMQAWLKQNGH